MTPDEVASFFKKSTSWVYKNWKILGGVKLGGSLFFPNQEEMYDLLFQQRKPVGGSPHSPGKQESGNSVQDQNKKQAEQNKQLGKIEKAATGGESSNRHGLFGPC
ncbi:MAG: hypothetical protein KJ990_09345 [Proteobacteria bacterium]|nr:hypothetical protein [Pseudomonadota bacterium]MBU1648025.1 hypothetical protein [Pseudomonadota bacterium]